MNISTAILVPDPSAELSACEPNPDRLEGTDAYLSAALMICKALAVRNTSANDEIAGDIDLLDKAIREIERQSGFLEEIKTSSSTIKNGADKILNRVETMRAAFDKQIGALDTQASLLRKLVQ